MEVISPSEQLLFTTVRIDITTNSGGQGTGTGFILTYNTSSGEIPFIVTNKHVISNAQKGVLSFTQANNGQPNFGVGYSIAIEGFEEIWYGHTDDDIDVAIAPLAPLVEHARQNEVQLFYKSIPNSLIPANDVIKSLDALEEVVFLGYPNGIWDQKNLLPIIRRGITATPIGIDFQGKQQFLIDAAVFPGSSGSPVFLFNTGMYFEKINNATVIGSRIFFLGIVAEVFFRQDINEIKIISVPTVDVPIAISRQMINLGIVFKASTIVETIKMFLRERGISTD